MNAKKCMHPIPLHIEQYHVSHLIYKEVRYNIISKTTCHQFCFFNVKATLFYLKMVDENEWTLGSQMLTLFPWKCVYVLMLSTCNFDIANQQAQTHRHISMMDTYKTLASKARVCAKVNAIVDYLQKN